MWLRSKLCTFKYICGFKSACRCYSFVNIPWASTLNTVNDMSNMSFKQKRIHLNSLRSRELTGSNLAKKTKYNAAAVAGESLTLHWRGLRGMCLISNSNTTLETSWGAWWQKASLCQANAGVDISQWISKHFRMKSQSKINLNINGLIWLLILLKHCRGPSG